MREVPELDDEFAKDLGEFDEPGRARKPDPRGSRGAQEARDRPDVRQSVLDKVLIENPIVLPDVLVEEEVRHRLEDMVRRMCSRASIPEKRTGLEELREQQEEPARKSVHARLVLDAVAGPRASRSTPRRSTSASSTDARHRAKTEQKLRSNRSKREGLEALKSQVLREKSLDLLSSVANIQDEE